MNILGRVKRIFSRMTKKEKAIYIIAEVLIIAILAITCFLVVDAWTSETPVLVNCFEHITSYVKIYSIIMAVLVLAILFVFGKVFWKVIFNKVIHRIIVYKYSDEDEDDLDEDDLDEDDNDDDDDYDEDDYLDEDWEDN